eukprot:g78944.t1
MTNHVFVSVMDPAWTTQNYRICGDFLSLVIRDAGYYKTFLVNHEGLTKVFFLQPYFTRPCNLLGQRPVMKPARYHCRFCEWSTTCKPSVVEALGFPLLCAKCGQELTLETRPWRKSRTG